MNTLDKARETQLRNIEARTGQSLEEMRGLVRGSGLTKHSELRAMLMERLGLGYGDANMLVHYTLGSDGQSAAEAAGASVSDVLDEIYTAPRSALRPIHDLVMAAAAGFGPFDVVPKKGYVSLRRQRQFAMVGPGTKGRLEVGLNIKGLEATPRLIAQPPGGMCQYKVFLTTADDVDKELVGWLRAAYDSAG